MVLAGLSASNGEARRLIQQGAVRIHDNKITDPQARIAPVNGMIVKSGKRGFAKLCVG